VDSVKACKWLDEAPYEVQGDEWFSNQAPRRARQSDSRQIFDGWHIAIDSAIQSLSISDIQRLCQLAGATVSMWEPQCDTLTDTFYIVLHDEPMDRHACSDSDSRHVDLTWLYDCISSFSVLPLDSYLI